MANSKHAHLRYNIMDKCFREKQFTFNELRDYINEELPKEYPGEGIEDRTLRGDLKVFRDTTENGFSAPLPPNIRTLKYEDLNFSIAQKPLLEYEQYLVKAARQLLERFDNHPKYNRLQEALLDFLDEEERDSKTVPFLFHDSSKEYKVIKQLKYFYLAIKNKKVLHITYKGFQEDAPLLIFEFHPHVLKQYNLRWFVYGWNASKDHKEWSIPLDERILNIEELDKNNYSKTDTDWKYFFRTMVGIRREGTVQDVELKFYNGREKYFKTKPFIEGSDEFFEKEKSDHVFFESIINPELVQQLLSFGKDVEVIKPQILKDRINEHVKSMFDHYN